MSLAENSQIVQHPNLAGWLSSYPVGLHRPVGKHCSDTISQSLVTSVGR